MFSISRVWLENAYSRPQNWGFGRSNETRAPIANPPNSAYQGAVPTTPLSYTRVRAVVWTCGRGARTCSQTDTQTDTHRHTDAGDRNTLRVVYEAREM